MPAPKPSTGCESFPQRCNPLAGGLLTGKQRQEAPLPGTRFGGNKNYLDRYWQGTNFEAVEDLSKVASNAGRSLVSLALNWLLNHSGIDCVIVGASRLEQLEENLSAAEQGPAGEEAAAACDRVWARVRGVSPQYNR